jgi:SPP1 gp7 family putative phage head morphogenesis protein
MKAKKGINNHYPKSIELKYQRDLTHIITLWLSKLLADLNQELPRVVQESKRYDSIRLDADYAKIIKSVVLKHKGIFSAAYLRMADTAATEVFGKTDQWQIHQQKNLESHLGVNLQQSSLWRDGAASAFVHHNTGLITKLSDDMSGKIESSVFQGIQAGATSREISKDINEVAQIGKPRARLIARDQVAKLNSNLTERRQTGAGITHYIWSTAHDERTCKQCAPRNGKRYSWDAEPKPGTIHVQCITGDSRVYWDGELQGITKSFYNGPVIKINTVRGKNLTVTPNDLIMTSNGWVLAKELKQGMKVVSNRISDDMFRVSLNNDNIPPKIEEMFEAFNKNGVSHVMEIAGEDFHSDGKLMKGKVEIIDINGFLRNDIKSTSYHNIIKLLFPKRVLVNSSFKCFAMMGQCLNRTLTSSHSIMSFLSFKISHLWIALVSKFFSFTSISPNPKMLQHLSDFRSRAEFAIRFFKTLRNTKSRLFRKISFDDILNIENNNFSGHVYDLQLSNSIYFANGVLKHNCRCTPRADLSNFFE